VALQEEWPWVASGNRRSHATASLLAGAGAFAFRPLIRMGMMASRWRVS